MLEVVQNTKSVEAAFKNLTDAGIQVGAKTGSAQVTGQENANGLFVCFAPYDDPQIAVCVAVEKPRTDAADQTARPAAPADTTVQDAAPAEDGAAPTDEDTEDTTAPNDDTPPADEGNEHEREEDG